MSSNIFLKIASTEIDGEKKAYINPLEFEDLGSYRDTYSVAAINQTRSIDLSRRTEKSVLTQSQQTITQTGGVKTVVDKSSLNVDVMNKSVNKVRKRTLRGILKHDVS
jgi:hypothetical protein